jgi:hypothetical protein
MQAFRTEVQRRYRALQEDIGADGLIFHSSEDEKDEDPDHDDGSAKTPKSSNEGEKEGAAKAPKSDGAKTPGESRRHRALQELIEADGLIFHPSEDEDEDAPDNEDGSTKAPKGDNEGEEDEEAPGNGDDDGSTKAPKDGDNEEATESDDAASTKAPNGGNEDDDEEVPDFEDGSTKAPKNVHEDDEDGVAKAPKNDGAKTPGGPRYRALQELIDTDGFIFHPSEDEDEEPDIVDRSTKAPKSHNEAPDATVDPKNGRDKSAKEAQKEGSRRLRRALKGEGSKTTGGESVGDDVPKIASKSSEMAEEKKGVKRHRVLKGGNGSKGPKGSKSHD